MSAEATGLVFLSWYRTGLAAAVTAPRGGAPLDTPPPAAVLVPVTATVGDPDDPSGAKQAGSVQVRLHAPGDVTGLDNAQIGTVYPTPGSANVPPDSFPLIEFARPDIPWILSPTGPQLNNPTDADPRRGLTPWLCLVAVEEPPAVLNAPASPHALPTLTVADSELPDLAESWLYAHAQVTVLSSDSADIPDLIAQQPTRALSRLLAPRYLKPDTSYLACVVPTFAPPDGSAVLAPAWRHSDAPTQVTLPVYHSWRFSTGQAGDFRSLVLELKAWDQGGVGVRPMDIGHAGQNMPSPPAGQGPWLINLEGALVSADAAASIGSWSDPAVQSEIQAGLTAHLDGSPGELTPPAYGSIQASFSGQISATTASGGWLAPTWLRTLNMDPRYRAAAAVGAALVRANQDALILSAWDQAGQARAANQVLRQGQLARELGSRTYTGRIGAPESVSPPMSDDRVLQLTVPVHAQIPAPAPEASVSGPESPTVAEALAANPAVAAAVSLPFRRLASPSGPLASRLVTGPLPAPVTSVARPGGIRPTPPLSPVTGMVALAAVSADSSAPETLHALTGPRVGVPRFGWEQGPVQPEALTDVLLQPGYLSDLWVQGSGLGRALDWDGTALSGWTGFPPISDFTQGPAQAPGGTPSAFYFPPDVYGGAASGIQWNHLGVPAGPAVAVTASSIEVLELTGDDGVTSVMYLAVVNCMLRGDAIPGVIASPVRAVGDLNGELQWPTIEIMSDPSSFTWPEGSAIPPLTLSTAITTADLTGSGMPSIAVAWSLSSDADLATTGPQVKIFFDVDVTGGAARTESVSLPMASGDVQSVLLANGLLYVLVSGQLLCTPVDAGGAFTANTGWLRTRPDNWVWASLTAADFSGSGRADLLFFYGVAVPGEEGAAAYRAAYRIGYEPDPASGEPAYWGEETGAPIPVTDVPASLILGPLDPATSALRQATAQAFRAAATATQTRMAGVIPAAAAAPPPPPVDVAGLAATVRGAVDPQVTVPASVTAKITPVTLAEAGGDVLQPIGFAPSFPQPFYETVRDNALPWLIPGLSSFPDEAITVLGSDTHAVEAMLIGANSQLSSELLWRGVPALRTATFFARFWDGRDAAGNATTDITDISTWAPGSDLGSHSPASATPGDAAVLLMRGDLIRRFPHVTIYAAPAISTADGSRTIDLTTRIDPDFSGTLGGDSAFAGFPFTLETARGSASALGMYFVFQEHPMAARFGLNLVTGTPSSFGVKPDAWHDLDWSGTVRDEPGYEALTYLDASAASPLWGVSLADNQGATGPLHRWGFSAAHMANITYRPPVLIAIHADNLLEAAGTGGTA
jgi:hypothetical protein